MSFRSSLAALNLGSGRGLPQEPKVARLLRQAPFLGAGAVERPSIDLDAVSQRIIDLIDQGLEPDRFDWRYAPWCLWATKPTLATHDGAFRQLLATVARMHQRGRYRRLASVYLAEYSPGRPRVDEVARVLAACANQADEPWRGLQHDYGIFDGRDGVRRIAEAALAKHDTVPGLLDRAGLGAVISKVGFAEASYLEGLNVLKTRAVGSAVERLEAIRRWCLSPDGTMIYEVHRAAMVDALVLPYRDVVPSAQDRDVLLRFLTSRFGDPRWLPGKWIGMEDAAAVVKRWLTDLSLRQFFDVVFVCQTNVHTTAWQQRRAFWQAYYDHGWIQDAWVALGPSGCDRTRRAFGPDAAFGRLTKGRKPVEPSHAVLLLNFGGCIVADWSHNGYCSIWPANERGAPAFFAKEYSSDAVQRASREAEISREVANHNMFHHGGNWQAKVAARIDELTGARVPERSYRVRDHGC
jgi:hypothetical protein